MASGSETVLKVRKRRNGTAAPVAISREKVEALRELMRVASACPPTLIHDIARIMPEYARHPPDANTRSEALGRNVTLLQLCTTDELCELADELAVRLVPHAFKAAGGGNGRE
ncbi:MAG: hypothetical protein ABIG44_04595 [Planctomycetota bacterium]